MDKIKAITKRPGMRPVSTWITPSLENLQKLVGGYVEVVQLVPGAVCVLCDEEGRLKGSEYNCTVNGHAFVGDLVLVGLDQDEEGEETFASLPFSYEITKAMFPGFWDGWRRDGND